MTTSKQVEAIAKRLGWDFRPHHAWEHKIVTGPPGAEDVYQLNYPRDLLAFCFAAQAALTEAQQDAMRIAVAKLWLEAGSPGLLGWWLLNAPASARLEALGRVLG